jgi:glycosyltransferase involved in cell wall biosynthesis
MKLALVTETYPPEVNGVAMTLSRLVRGLASRGHQVQVVRPRQSKTDGPSQDGQVQQVTLPGVPMPRYDGLHLGLPAKGKLKRRWRSDQPDIVHIATEGPLGATALWAAKSLHIPVASSFHTNFHAYGKHYGYHFLSRAVVAWLRYVHNQTGVTLVPSLDVQEALQASGFRNVEILARGVDNELFGPHRRSAALRESWGVGPDDVVAIYVGRVAPEKNVPLAVRAFEAMRVADTNPSRKLKFVVVGDGPARARLEQEHADYHFAGMRRGEDLAAHYASADVFLFPSITETFGNVVTEAMASGLCALAYDYAAPRQYIQSGGNGFTAAFDDADAFLATAAKLVKMPVDELRQLGAAARHTALGISWDAIIDQFESQLRRVMSSSVSA